jgi:hypothetical protein
LCLTVLYIFYILYFSAYSTKRVCLTWKEVSIPAYQLHSWFTFFPFYEPTEILWVKLDIFILKINLKYPITSKLNVTMFVTSFFAVSHTAFVRYSTTGFNGIVNNFRGLQPSPFVAYLYYSTTSRNVTD